MRLEAAGSGGHHGNGPLVVGVSANRKLRPVPAYDRRTPGGRSAVESTGHATT